MIGFVRGIVHAFGMDWVLVDVHDVGYRINFYHPESLKTGEEIIIYTYQNVREDELSLYGFLSLKEYDLFVDLISVKGLGPKIASGILAKASVESIIAAIEEGNVDFMQRMPGVGKKTASQIILDLKGKLVESSEQVIDNEKLKDVQEVLKALGYKPMEIKPVIKRLENEDGSTDELVKKALSMLKK
ncbi:MAG: Holliday junction branch migration protein RuvA [Erysipelotrichaceae bacterium]|nr:Holliday junction branch migration protein RuvA [Erysipelotrichaceae bacterium]